MEPSQHVEGMRCLECGYDLSGLAYGPCPECGEEMGEAAAAMHERRIAFVASTCAWARTKSTTAAAIAVVYVGGAAAFGGADTTGAALGMFGLVVVSGVLGVLVSYLSPALHRRMVMLAWLRYLWILHIPWLVVAPGVVLLGIVSLVDRGTGRDPGLFDLVALFLFTVWGLGSFLCIPFWLAHWEERLVAVAPLRAFRPYPVLILLVLGTLAASWILGVIGGITMFQSR